MFTLHVIMFYVKVMSSFEESPLKKASHEHLDELWQLKMCNCVHFISFKNIKGNKDVYSYIYIY